MNFKQCTFQKFLTPLRSLLGLLGYLGPSEIGFAFHPVYIHYRADGMNLLGYLGYLGLLSSLGSLS